MKIIDEAREFLNEEIAEEMDSFEAHDFFLGRDDMAQGLIGELLKQLEESQLFVKDLKDVISDHQRLVRELDVIWNGEDGAAPQASLCDMVAQIKKEKPEYIYCHACSKAGGAEMPIYHSAPACPDSAE